MAGVCKFMSARGTEAYYATSTRISMYHYREAFVALPSYGRNLLAGASDTQSKVVHFNGMFSHFIPSSKLVDQAFVASATTVRILHTHITEHFTSGFIGRLPYYLTEIKVEIF